MPSEIRHLFLRKWEGVGGFATFVCVAKSTGLPKTYPGRLFSVRTNAGVWRKSKSAKLNSSFTFI